MSGKVFHQVASFSNPALPDNIYYEDAGDVTRGYVTDDSGTGKRIGHTASEMVSDIDSEIGDAWRTNSIDCGEFT